MLKKLMKGLIVFFAFGLVFSSLSSLAFAEQSSGATKKITILHTNDTHSRVEESAQDGMGFAKISTLVQKYRKENPNTLLLDAGDTFHGTNFATLVKGESITKVMNKVGYDAMAPGNHDFNYGYKRLLELEKMIVFPLVSANVRYENGERLFKPYVIKEVDGIKLGIFGLTTPETTYKTHPKNVEGLKFTDPAVEAKAMVSELKGKVDMIIAVTHLGIDESSTDTSIKVAKEAPGIDLIVDGHSHSTLVEGKQADHNTLIVSSGEYTKNLGVVELTFDGSKLKDKKAKLVSKQEVANVEPDPVIVETIGTIKKEQEKVLAEVIGKTAVKLDGEREQVRAGETNLGNLIADAMIDVSGAELSMTNGGGIRASIPQGDITKGSVTTVLPFGNYIITKKVRGADIKAALENGTSAYPKVKGAFPHVGGMTYAIDTSKPEGQRVHSITIQGKPLDPKREYVMATNDFMAAGGDEYVMFKDYPIANEFPALDEALISYIQKLGNVQVKSEGRIKAEAEQKVETQPERNTGQPEPSTEQKPETVSKPNPKDEDKTTQPDANAKPDPTPEKQQTVYIVKSGDNLTKIAKKYGTTWRALHKLNHLRNPNLIFPGQKIIVN